MTPRRSRESGGGFGRIAQGAVWALASQAGIFVAQFAYSGLTARIFRPADFGGLAGAFSLQALLILLTTIGLPSFVLMKAEFTRQDIVRVRGTAFVGGAVAAGLLLAIGPVWLRVLGVPEGLIYLPLLAVGIVVNALATAESALFRREARLRADAVMLLATSMLGIASAAVMAVVTRDQRALAVAPLVTALATLAVSRLARRAHYSQSAGAGWGEILRYTARVSGQNVVLYLIRETPSWAMGRVFGAATLGQMNRGQGLTYMPSLGLANAFARVMQPHWRTINQPGDLSRTRRDAVTITGSAAFPVFAIVAALSAEIVVLWLGPGWELAAALVPALAVAAAVHVPFQVLVHSFEMRAQFREVRAVLLLRLAVLVGAIGAAVLLQSPQVVVAGMAVTSFVSLVTLAGLSGSDGQGRTEQIRAVLNPTFWAAVIGASAHAGAVLTAALLPGASPALRLLLGGACGALAWAVTFRWQRVARILAERGIRLPRALVWLP